MLSVISAFLFLICLVFLVWTLFPLWFLHRRWIRCGGYLQWQSFRLPSGQPTQPDSASGRVCVCWPRKQAQCQPHRDPGPRQTSLPAQQQARRCNTRLTEVHLAALTPKVISVCPIQEIKWAFQSTDALQWNNDKLHCKLLCAKLNQAT